MNFGWQNYRSIFFDDAYIATSWKQGNLDKFIQASKDGFAKGSSFIYILHCIIGSSVETNPELTRAVCKIKVTITLRFTFDYVEMDNEATAVSFSSLKSETVVGGFASTFSFLIKTIYPCQSWEDLPHSRGGGRPISITISLPFLG
jgi:hypothetical protein